MLELHVDLCVYWSSCLRTPTQHMFWHRFLSNNLFACLINYFFCNWKSELLYIHEKWTLHNWLLVIGVVSYMLLLSEISWQQAVFTDISKVYFNDQFDYFKLAFFFIHQIHKMFVIVYIHYWNAWRSIKKNIIMIALG